jgi:hypothetical protein
MNLRFSKAKTRRLNWTPDVTPHSQAVQLAEYCGVTVNLYRILEFPDSNIGRRLDILATHFCSSRLLHVNDGITL